MLQCPAQVRCTPDKKGCSIIVEKALTKCVCAAAAIGCIIVAVYFLCANKNDKTDELETKDIETAISEAKDFGGKKYQNLSLPESINIPQTDSIYKLTVTSRGSSDPKEGLNKLCMALAGKEPTDIKEKDNGASTSVNGEYQAEFYSSGSFLYAKSPEDPDNPWGEYDTDTVTASYDLEKDDISGISYDLGGKQYSLSDALSLAEKTVTEKLSSLLKWDTQTKAKEIVVYESAERGHYYYVTFEHYVDRIPILRAGSGDPLDPRVFPSRLDIHIHDPNVATVVSNYAYTELVDKQPVKEIVTLGSALKKIEKELAPEKVYEIKDVRLEYAAVDTVIGGSDKKEYHPAWCFIISNQARDTIMPDPKEILIFDAVTGDISLWNDRDMQFVFGAPKPSAIRNDDIYTVEMADEIKREYDLSDEEFKKLIEQ